MKTKVKIGIGYDAHRFAEDGNFVMLCGVKVASHCGIIAHSDGDVALHALTDALLGAIGESDIGHHFPPSDTKWRNTDSKFFLKFANDLLKKKGGEISNIDLIIICETPKISIHRKNIIKSLAEILEISELDINVKATTTEGMGFTGRKEGIACQASVCVSLN
jgi:2-C-methyl-D-erythritol 4-phosphate cytidylyltransferase / 2-C-methyl-D-erythritol 2,4-cyclodiphosphate synthase